MTGKGERNDRGKRKGRVGEKWNKEKKELYEQRGRGKRKDIKERKGLKRGRNKEEEEEDRNAGAGYSSCSYQLDTLLRHPSFLYTIPHWAGCEQVTRPTVNHEAAPLRYAPTGVRNGPDPIAG